MRIPNRIKECKIMGVDIACTSMNHLLRIIKDRLPELSGNYICATNVHAIVTAYRDESYRKVQNDAFMRLPDGAPVAMVAGTRSETRAEKISGPDVMTEIFKVSASYGYKHYFYGSTEETLKKLEDTLYKKYPGINIVGMKSPPFRPLTKEEDAEVIRDINHAEPDFIWVGLGAPKQEIWMYEHQEKVKGLMLRIVLTRTMIRTRFRLRFLCLNVETLSSSEIFLMANMSCRKRSRIRHLRLSSLLLTSLTV